jgi:hypothetical protein
MLTGCAREVSLGSRCCGLTPIFLSHSVNTPIDMDLRTANVVREVPIVTRFFSGSSTASPKRLSLRAVTLPASEHVTRISRLPFRGLHQPLRSDTSQVLAPSLAET